MNIDQWAAEQCGVRVGMTNDGRLVPHESKSMYKIAFWTINDARCREIVREHFKITTMYRPAGWVAMQNKWTKRINIAADQDDRYICLSGIGKTIAEAEIACIKAIYESES